MTVQHITKETFEKEVLNADKPVLLDFYAVWCGPCKMIAPILDEIAAEREDIKVCKVNVDEEPELAARYQVVSIPSLFIIKDGQVTNRALGAKPKAQILEML